MFNSSQSKAFLQSNWRLLFVFILVIIAYFPTFFNGFTNWDDLNQVTNNADITSLSFHHIKVFFSSFYVGMYQPLATLCFAVIFKLFALKALAYHIFSLLLHLVNVFLVYKIVKKLTEKKEIVFFVTLLFAVNPMQTEAVAWVSATSTLLYSMFYLLSVNVYLNYIKSENNNKNYFISLLFFLFALFSKSAAVTLPLILLLFDYFIHSKISKKDLLNKIPFLILSILFGILTIIARKEAGHIIDITKYYSFLDRILFILYSLSFYITSVFAPFRMSAFHPYPDKLGGMLPIILYSLSFYITSVFAPFRMSAFHPYPDKLGGMLPILFYLTPLLIIAIAVFMIKVKRNRKEIIFGILFFLLSISVMIELIPVGIQIVKERYTYISCIGLYFAFFTFLVNVFENSNTWKKLFTYFIIALSLVFVVFSFMRTRLWKDSFTLWDDVLKKYPHCSAAFINRGNAYIVQGNYDQAITDINKAIEIEPNAADAYMNRAVAKNRLNDLGGAIEDYDKAISIGPLEDRMFVERAILKNANHDIDGAIDDISQAIGLSPDKEKYYNQRGIYYGMKWEFGKAAYDFSKAIEIDNEYSEAWSNRGFAKLNQFDFEGAIKDLTTAIEINPSSAQTYYVRGLAELKANDASMACKDFHKSYELGFKAAKEEIEKVCGE